MSILPFMQLSQSNWPHIKDLQLADPSLMTSGSVDFIVSADVYVQLVLPELIKGPFLTPMVFNLLSPPISQSTIFDLDTVWLSWRKQPV